MFFFKWVCVCYCIADMKTGSIYSTFFLFLTEILFVGGVQCISNIYSEYSGSIVFFVSTNYWFPMFTDFLDYG